MRDELRENDKVLTTVFSALFLSKKTVKNNELNLRIIHAFYTRLSQIQYISEIFLEASFWENVDGTKFGQDKQIDACDEMSLEDLVISESIDVVSLSPEEMFLVNILKDWNLLKEERA